MLFDFFFLFAACDKGYYKSAYNTTCVPCPENTKQDTEAATFCECKDGFFRADHEGVGVDCTGMILL